MEDMLWAKKISDSVRVHGGDGVPGQLIEGARRGEAGHEVSGAVGEGPAGTAGTRRGRQALHSARDSAVDVGRRQSS